MKSFATKAAAKTPAKTPAKGVQKQAQAPSKSSGKAKTAVEPDPTKEVAVMPNKSIVPTGAEDSDVSGEVNSSDIKLPYLNIVQGVGDLSAIFDPGQIIVAGEVPMTTAPEKDGGKAPILEIAVIWARKQYVEMVDYDSGERGRIFDTEAGVLAAGLHLDWVDNVPPPAGPMLTCLVLVKQTELAEESGSPYFSLEYGKDAYAPCMWRLQRTAYTRAAKTILSAKAMSRTEPLCTKRFQLCAKREKVGKNWIFTPFLRAVGKYDADFVEFVKANAQ